VGFWHRLFYGEDLHERAGELTLEQVLGEPGNSWLSPSPTNPGNTKSGVTVNSDTAQALPALYACVLKICELSAGLPIHAYRDGSKEPVSPQPRILDEPSADFAFDEWVHATLRSALTAGYQIGLIVDRDGASLRPSQVELLADGRVTVNDETDHARGGSRRVWRLDGQQIDRSALWHFRGHVAAGNVLGLSPVRYARETIGLGLGAARFAGDFFGGDAVPLGVLQGDSSGEWFANKEEFDDTYALVTARRLGKRRTAMLKPGLKWQQISLSPSDVQLIETERWTAQQVCAAYGVPPEEIGMSSGNSMTYANLETRGLALLKFGLDPWLMRMERRFTRDFLPRGQFAKFTRAGLLRTDTLGRYQAYEIGVRGGWLTIEEVRAWEDLEPLTAEQLAGRRRLEAVA
jgi:HK97 family phage portal protein